MIKVSATIAIYNEDREILQKAIDSFLKIKFEKELIIVDNSKEPYLRDFCRSYKYTKYIFTDRNLGFARAHNLGFKNLTIKSTIHIVINPDVYFQNIDNLIEWMQESEEIAISTPRIYSIDGTIQNTIREIPTPTTLFKRRLNTLFGFFDKFVKRDEYANFDFRDIQEIPSAHGCFLLFKRDIYEKLLGFDEKFFLYMEDIDIFIRAKKYGKTVINPHYIVYHKHRKGSHKSLKLLLYHIKSSIIFFWKWRSLLLK